MSANKQSTKPRLSLSMIIKNEAKFLDGCLASVRDVIDEIVIVDTGSTDDSKAIASRYGAKIFDFAWIGDFSAARNFSLNQCTGEWVVCLDADERIAEGHGTLLRELLRKQNVSAYSVRIESEFQRGAIRQSNSYPRLFRRVPGVQFEGRVHEQILPSLQRLMVDVVPSPLAIIHLGYSEGGEVLKRKSIRNIELLRKQLDMNPQDAYARFQLGNSLAILQEHDAAKAELEVVVADRTLPRSCRAVAFNLLADVEVKQGNVVGAMEYCRKSLAIAPDQLMAHWFLALSLCDQKKFAEAIPLLEKVERLVNVLPEKRSSSIAADLDLKKDEVLLKLAESFEQIGKYREARDRYAAALEYVSNTDKAVVGLMRCAERVGESRRALDTLESLSKKNPARSELLFVQAWQCHSDGEHATALQHLDQIINVHPGSARAYILSLRWRMEAGDISGAERVLSIAEQHMVKDFELHRCGLDLSLKQGNLSAALRHLEFMMQTTDADLTPLKNRIAAIAAKLPSSSVPQNAVTVG